MENLKKKTLLFGSVTETFAVETYGAYASDIN